jgi:small conductance mechanosensitive channel
MAIDIDLRTFLITAGLRIAGVLMVLIVGRWIARLLQRSVGSLLKRTTLSPALSQIIIRSVYYSVLLIATFSALVILGISAEILLAALAILVLVAAVALRESLRDLAATVNFVIFQPFKIGDLIETNGTMGIVKEILLFQTILITSENRQTIIPNGNIQNNTIVNFSVLPQSRLDLTVHLSYSDDVSATKDALLEIANADSRVLQTPTPVVDVMELGAGQVKYVLRVYAGLQDLWALQPALNERIKLLMEQRQLTVPLPQLQLHADQNLSLTRTEKSIGVHAS